MLLQPAFRKKCHQMPQLPVWNIIRLFLMTESTSAGGHACRCFIRSGNAVKFSEIHLTLQHIVLDVLHPLTCLSFWTAQITRRRCELCFPYLPDKAGGLQNTALAGFPHSAGEQNHQCWECRQTKHPSDKGWIPRRPRHSGEEVYQTAALVLDLLSATDTLVL